LNVEFRSKTGHWRITVDTASFPDKAPEVLLAFYGGGKLETIEVGRTSASDAVKAQGTGIGLTKSEARAIASALMGAAAEL
jgi:hypothetical protein